MPENNPPGTIREEYYAIRTETVSELRKVVESLKSAPENGKNSELLAEIRKLEAELKRLKKTKRYGLVWEEKPEVFEAEAKNALPVLEEVGELAFADGSDKPQNLIIEGDNFHSLAALSYTHKGLVDVIYIDPPYNTGNKDFVYNDRYVDKEDDFRHSKWLSFMEKRLRLARDLLKETGVIFISIDDNEQAQLKMLCDEIFHEKQFVADLVWEKKKKGSHLDWQVINVKEYALVYCKDKWLFKWLVGEVNYEPETYPCINPGNGYSIRKIFSGTKSNYLASNHFLPEWTIISAWNMKLTLKWDLIIKEWVLTKDVEIEWEWRYNQRSMDIFSKKWELYLTRDLYVRRIVNEPREKMLKDVLMRTAQGELFELYEEFFRIISEWRHEKVDTLREKINKINASTSRTNINPDNLYQDWWGSNEDGDEELRSFFWEKVFDFPKPVKLIQKLLASTRMNKGIVLDFFSGTGTTGHAVLQLNKEDGGNRRFILCSNKENSTENPNKNLCREVCYERVKRVSQGYENTKGETVEGLGGNVRYFKTAFVPHSKSTDDLRHAFVDRCSDLLRIKEDCFDAVPGHSDDAFRAYSGNGKNLALVYDPSDLSKLKDYLDKTSGPVTAYVFAIAPEPFAEELAEWSDRLVLEPIPDGILSTYRKVYGI